MATALRSADRENKPEERKDSASLEDPNEAKRQALQKAQGKGDEKPLQGEPMDDEDLLELLRRCCS